MGIPFHKADPNYRDATRDTMTMLIWISAVETMALSHVACIDRIEFIEWTRTPDVHSRVLRAGDNGESVWMAASELVVRWEGARRAKREGADGRAIIRGALR